MTGGTYDKYYIALSGIWNRSIGDGSSPYSKQQVSRIDLRGCLCSRGDRTRQMLVPKREQRQSRRVLDSKHFFLISQKLSKTRRQCIADIGFYAKSGLDATIRTSVLQEGGGSKRSIRCGGKAKKPQPCFGHYWGKLPSTINLRKKKTVNQERFKSTLRAAPHDSPGPRYS